MRTAVLRAARPTSAILPTLRHAARPLAANVACQQSRNAHAISNPTLANIENRWEAMPLQEQADLWMALRDRMKGDWHELTVNEKKAGMWDVSFVPEMHTIEEFVLVAVDVLPPRICSIPFLVALVDQQTIEPFCG